MPNVKIKFKDEDGFHYKHPDRDCVRCLRYPCLANMNKLKCNFAAYGCRNWSDPNIFEVWKPKK